MLIAQITDLHIGFDPDDPNELNRRRLDRVVARLNAMARQPDLILATGDLVDRGDTGSYRLLRHALTPLSAPVHLVLGNHDRRDAFAAVFLERPLADGFLHYAIEAGPLRVLVLDTLEEGRHGGAFCGARARWLAARLAEAPGRPTLLVLHHPPVATGIDWMSVDPAEPWIAALDGAIGDHANIVGLVCGHIHRAMATQWRGRPLIVCPSTAPQVALDLAPLDPAMPDGRAMIVADAPAFALHWWTGDRLVSHFDVADRGDVLARYDARMQPMVAHMMAERAGDVHCS